MQWHNSAARARAHAHTHTHTHAHVRARTCTSAARAAKARSSCSAGQWAFHVTLSTTAPYTQQHHPYRECSVDTPQHPRGLHANPSTSSKGEHQPRGRRGTRKVAGTTTRCFKLVVYHQKAVRVAGTRLPTEVIREVCRRKGVLPVPYVGGGSTCCRARGAKRQMRKASPEMAPNRVGQDGGCSRIQAIL